ncbi:hypothetical protein [Sinorhizobium fredii]|uniref:hypothetical protein n=1 Tax=Rhizobium fredii TaxID=380 RepID=UPI00138B0863|nr:hypothetical protein [Sinorhizobium fredii]MCG5476581.1 hypothetical protein [Sinorhizobium fredii]
MHIFQAHNYDALFLDIVVRLAKRFPRAGQNSLKRVGTLQILSMQVDRPLPLQAFGRYAQMAGNDGTFAVHDGGDWRIAGPHTENATK